MFCVAENTRKQRSIPLTVWLLLCPPNVLIIILLYSQVRLLILEKHGGIWMDVDSVILRDLRPFLELTGEFLSLSCSLRSFFNNNVMGFRAGSANIRTLINMVCGMGPWPTDHGDYNNKVAMIGGDPTFMADWYVVLNVRMLDTKGGKG